MSIRTLSTLALMAMFIFAQPHVLHAQQSPKAIAEGYIAEMDVACKAEGRNFLVLYDPIIEIDLGGTVEREVIFDQKAYPLDAGVATSCEAQPPGRRRTFVAGTCE
jgi:hypothetical protein